MSEFLWSCFAASPTRNLALSPKPLSLASLFAVAIMTGERSIPTLDRAPFFKASTENCPLPHPRSRTVRPEIPESISRLIRIVLLGDNPFRWYSSQWSRALESKCSLIHFVSSAFSQQAPVKPNSPRECKKGRHIFESWRYSVVSVSAADDLSSFSRALLRDSLWGASVPV